MSLLVKADKPNHPDRYIWVGEDKYLVIKSAIADPNSVHGKQFARACIYSSYMAIILISIVI